MHSAMSRSDAVAEVERYMAIPGQALAYKIGQLEISRLREEAQRSLGVAVRRPRISSTDPPGRLAAATHHARAH